MTDLIAIPSACLYNRDIPIEHFYTKENKNLGDSINRLTWVASLKPQIINVVSCKNEKVRYEELQIINLRISRPDDLYRICRTIYKTIKYPCLLVIDCENKFMLGTCPFIPGKTDYDNNVLKTLYFSHWIYPDRLSANARVFLDTVNQVLENGGDLSVVYKALCDAVMNFRLSGLTKTHVSKLLYDLTGKKTMAHLLDHCTPYKQYSPKNSSKKAKYEDHKLSNCYVWRYDTEEVWYTFNTHESIRRIIEGRRYSDINDLIYRIDLKIF